MAFLQSSMVQPLAHFLSSVFQHYLALLKHNSERKRYFPQGFWSPFSFPVPVPFTLQCPSKPFIHFSRNILPIPLSILTGFCQYPFPFHPDCLPSPGYPFHLDIGKNGNYDLQVELSRSNKSIWKAINPNSLKLLICFLLYFVHSQFSDILTFWTLLSHLKVIGNLLTIMTMVCLLLSVGHISSKIVLLYKNPLNLFHLGLKATISNPCSSIKVIRLCETLANIQQRRTSIYHFCNQDYSNCSVGSPLFKCFFIPNVNLSNFKDDFIYLGGHKGPASSLKILGSLQGNPNPHKFFLQDFSVGMNFSWILYLPIWIQALSSM